MRMNDIGIYREILFQIFSLVELAAAAANTALIHLSPLLYQVAWQWRLYYSTTITKIIQNLYTKL